MPAKQMLSAIGQSRLMQIYGDYFDIFQIVVAQVLLTREDISVRMRYLNARDTLQTLLERRIIPIVNENDTIATDEIRVGDNDNLSALVASALEADTLIMLTDQAGLYTADPRQHAHAELIHDIHDITPDIIALAGGAGTGVGTGGMVTKIQAAQIATRAGVNVIIANGKMPDILARLIAGEKLGTHFHATGSHLESRKRWLLTDRTQGAVTIDAGAVRALMASDGASLLPVGITQIDGNFKRSATLSIYDPKGDEIAHGLSNYDSHDLRQLMGHKSQDILQILGYSYGDAAIHRNNLVLLQKK
jgi:glutamate 5-kinase